MNGISTSQMLDVLKSRLGLVDARLAFLSQKGQSLIYRLDADSRHYFVKWPDEMARMYPLLRVSSDCSFLPRSAFDAPVQIAGGYISCVEWAASETVPPERWTNHQLESFMAAYESFSSVLQRTSEVGNPEDDETNLSIVRDYARRHPLVGQLVKPLLSLLPEERTYLPGERLKVTHGDLHSGNYGFRGENFAFFYDIDNILWGYPADDLAYTVLDRAQRRSVSGVRFARCVEILRTFVAHFGCPAREWRAAINRKRLRQAASKISRRPDSVVPAIDIALRDRRAVRLMRDAGLLNVKI